jgi:hypothetical protein
VSLQDFALGLGARLIGEAPEKQPSCWCLFLPAEFAPRLALSPACGGRRVLRSPGGPEDLDRHPVGCGPGVDPIERYVRAFSSIVSSVEALGRRQTDRWPRGRGSRSIAVRIPVPPLPVESEALFRTRTGDPLLTMERLRQAVAANGNGFGLFPPLPRSAVCRWLPPVATTGSIKAPSRALPGLAPPAVDNLSS